VLEAGVWTLPGGVQLAVGRVSTAATVGRLLTNQWQSIPFSDPFPATPVVLSQVQTNNDPHRVGTRQEAVTASGFQVATFAALSAGPSTPIRAGLEEEEANTAAHGPEVGIYGQPLFVRQLDRTGPKAEIRLPPGVPAWHGSVRTA